MQQGRAAEPQQVGVVVPATNDLVDVENRVLRVGFVPHRHHAAAFGAVQHEDRHPRGQQARLEVVGDLRPQCGSVDGEEGVRGVAGGLGPLATRDHVLDRVLVEAEFVGELADDPMVRVAHVHPDQRALLVEVLRNVGEGKVLGLQLAIEPQTGPAVVTHESTLPTPAY